MLVAWYADHVVSPPIGLPSFQQIVHEIDQAVVVACECEQRLFLPVVVLAGAIHDAVHMSSHLQKGFAVVASALEELLLLLLVV